jgi:alpha-ketoglutarate-dependent taurine dioxygenase
VSVCQSVKLQLSNVLPIIESEEKDVSLAKWIGENAGTIEALLDSPGAMLFRGFPISDEKSFQDVVEAFSRDRLQYIYRSTPRRELADRIYTTTEYPKNFEIPMHNENSFQRDWPMRLLFCCIQPATQGGCTPLVPTERVTENIDPAVRQKFKEKKVMYVRNYGLGIDLPWETVFQTQQKSEVEQFCKANGLEFEWRPRNALRTRQICQAVARHPRTGKELWFNQAHLFHISSLDAKTRAAMSKLLREDELPRNAYYGDGSSIEPEILAHIRAAHEVEKIVFSWQSGDILLLDNMLLCHGRQAFQGERKVLAAMTHAFSTMAGAAQS